MLDLTNKVEVPHDKLIALIKGVYERSEPIGLGYLQPFHEDLSDDEAKLLITPKGWLAVYMDYVKGRCCKFRVFRDEKTGKLYTPTDAWMDHDTYQLEDLLKSVGLMT